MKKHVQKAFSTFLLILFSILKGIHGFAQKQTNIWYFGDNAGLDFNFSPPKPLYDGKLYSNEGAAVMADTEGKLLFYTDGETIWNKAHQIMDNGNDIGGHNSARQSSLIIPVPGEEKFYYVFTVDAQERNHRNGVSYSVVDMDANEGLGKVTEKKVQLHAPGLESLAGVGNCIDGGESTAYWIAALNLDYPDRIYAYYSREGIRKTPVISIWLRALGT